MMKQQYFLFLVFLLLILFVPVFEVQASVVGSSVPSIMKGLIAWWTLDGKDTSQNVADLSGNSRHGFIQPAAATSSMKTQGKLGQAFKFDGASTYFQTSPAVLSSATNVLTFSWWMRNSPNTNLQTILSSNGQTDPYIWVYRGAVGVNQNIITWQFHNGSAASGMSSPATFLSGFDDKWVHIVGVLDYTNKTLDWYRNGAFVFRTVTANTPSFPSANAFWRIGSYSGSVLHLFEGYLDDIRIYNRALSAAEINQLYSQGSGLRSGTGSATTAGQFSNGLVGYWTFDGKNMINNVADSSGQGKNGSMIGFTSTSSAVTQGKNGQALRFDGVDDAVSFSYINGITTTGSYTMSLWFNTANAGTVGGSASGGIINISNGANNRNGIGLYGAYVMAGYWNGTSYVGLRNSTPVTLNKWHHVVYVNNAGTVSLYYDGAAQNTSFMSALGTENQLGKNANQAYFNGALDDVRVYNRALSESEIAQLYASGVGNKIAVAPPAGAGQLTNGLIGYWNFDGKNMINNVADLSGTGNPGYLQGFTSTSSMVTAGKIGQGVMFDGITNEYITMGDPANGSLDMGVNDFSISVWAKLKVIGTAQVLVSKSNLGPASSIGYDILYRSDIATHPLQLRLGNNNAQQISTTGAPDLGDGKWHHVVTIADRDANAEIYVDGKRYGLAGISGEPANGNLDNSLSFFIGRRPDGVLGMLGGAVDEVRVYNRVLSAKEVQQLYQMGR